MLLKNEFKFLFSKRNILALILVLISVLSVYFFKYNTEYEQYASNQIMYYYETLNEENQRINILPKEKLNAFFREDSIYCQKLLSDWKNDEDVKIIAKDMYDRDQNILKYIDSGMDLSNFKSILQNNKQDLKKRIQMEKTYIENEYYDFVYQNKPTIPSFISIFTCPKSLDFTGFSPFFRFCLHPFYTHFSVFRVYMIQTGAPHSPVTHL